ncbi:uncharacterized protein [Amphiura filiformis]|uniref:uncharacterized protein isoform X2 n=1 Tax=Amphiura filiformis TaxID=82378 RepID=UPI003B210A11
MPSAGAVAVPTIIPLRVPQAGKSASQIDTNTLVEIKADSGTSIYFTSNGSKPMPFRKNDKNTIKYKGPFLLNQGKRSIKALAVSRNGLSESAVVSKTFMVEWCEPDDEPCEDDDQSFIMDSRPKSSMMRRSHQYSDIEDFVDAARTSNNYGALTHSHTFPVGNPAPTMAYNAWGPQPVATMQKTPDYLFHYHMHENRPGFNQPPARQSLPPPPQPSVRPPVQVSAMGPYADNDGWRSLSVPLPAVLNQNVGTQTVGLFYPTHEQLTQNPRDVEQVRRVTESSTSMAPPREQEKTVNLSEMSPGKGYWKRQVAHISAHLEAFTQRDAEFRADVGKPKMGKITFASIEDDGVDVTVTVSFESQTDTPNVRHNKASMARREALLSKSMTSDSDSPYSGTKKKKKPITKKLAAKKKTEEEDRLTAEDRQLLKEVGPKGDGDPDAIQEFLDEGADPNCENNNGVPALVVAAMNNHVDALLVLIDAGAKVNTKSTGKKGNTALHEAVLLGPDGQEAIEVLLEAGASAKAKNTKGETPYDLAVKNGYESVVALFASSMGQDMLDKMSDSKKEKGSRRREREREEKETAAPEVDRKYKEKRPKDKGTVVAASKFDAQADAEKLRKAMKGFGTDEKAIIEVLTQRDTTQRQKVSKQFKQMFGKDLVKEFKSELSGKLLDMVQGLMMTPSHYDAYQLNKAIKGLGTDEDVLIEILCTRSNSAIEAIKEAYDDLYHKDLEEDVADDTSGHFERLLVSVLQGARPEDNVVDPDKAKADAMDLYKAGEEKWGTDESRFNVILMSRSQAQLRATFDEYARISKHDIEAAIKKEMSGDLKTSMLTVVRCVINKHKYFADRLQKTMKGAGTDDATLMRIVVSRCEIDMQNIKAEFSNAYGQTLGKFIAGDTSGDYKKILLALVGGES